MNTYLRILVAAIALVGVSLVGEPAGGQVLSSVGPPPHGAITIASDADFGSCTCVTSGSGTAANPFVIGPWKVTAPARGGWAFKADNSKGKITKYFNVAGITAGYDDPDPSHNMVWLIMVTKTTNLSNLVANATGTGVRLDSVANVNIGNVGSGTDGVNFNKMPGDGIFVNSSSNVSIVNSKSKSMMYGLQAENSANLSIGVGCAANVGGPNTGCNQFTYDDFYGVYLHNTHDSVVNSTANNAEDTAGIILDGSGTYNNEVEFSQGNANGSICPAGVPTGLKNDVQSGIGLINGAHDNFIHNNTFNGNWTDILGKGKGFFENPCTGLNDPRSPATPAMGPGNVFKDNCYKTTNIDGLEPFVCPQV